MANVRNHVLNNRAFLAAQIKERQRYQLKKQEEEHHKKFLANRTAAVWGEKYHKPWMVILHQQALEENLRRDRLKCEKEIAALEAIKAK